MKQVQLMSLNIGKAQPSAVKAVGFTGIHKKPVAHSVWVSELGLQDDAVCDVENHGGVDQAVYVFGEPDYAWWSEQLGTPLHPGMFGENLTLSNLNSAEYFIGDRLYFEHVILEVTAPRIPCVTLATRMADPTFLIKFRHAERPGLYCRVIRAGYLRVGEMGRVEPLAQPTLSAIDMFRDFYEPDLSRENMLRHLAAPICVRGRIEKEMQLKKLVGE